MKNRALSFKQPVSMDISTDYHECWYKSPTRKCFTESVCTSTENDIQTRQSHSQHSRTTTSLLFRKHVIDGNILGEDWIMGLTS